MRPAAPCSSRPARRSDPTTPLPRSTCRRPSPRPRRPRRRATCRGGGRRSRIHGSPDWSRRRWRRTSTSSRRCRGFARRGGWRSSPAPATSRRWAPRPRPATTGSARTSFPPRRCGNPGGPPFGIPGSEFNSFRFGLDASWEIDLFGGDAARGRGGQGPDRGRGIDRRGPAGLARRRGRPQLPGAPLCPAPPGDRAARARAAGAGCWPSRRPGPTPASPAVSRSSSRRPSARPRPRGSPRLVAQQKAPDPRAGRAHRPGPGAP